MHPALIHTPGLRRFTYDLDAERQLQLARFGDQRHPDGTGRLGYAQKATTARFACQTSAVDEEGGPRWSLVLLEEVYEALAETDRARLRVELVQVAAVCAAWVWDIDQRPPNSPDAEDVAEATAKLRAVLAPGGPAEQKATAAYETALTDMTESPEDTVRRYARRLRAVEHLVGGRPGYDTVTVKQLLTAMSAADDAPSPAGDHFTEAAIRRSAYLDAAREADEGSKLFPDTTECAAAIGALEGLAQRLRRLADHHTTAEQPTGPTWEARADHAIRLYARTAIERDDARAEHARLRARVAELEQQAAPDAHTEHIEAEAAVARVRSWCDDLDASVRHQHGDPHAEHPHAVALRLILDPQDRP
ncbi:hypothetical protein ACFUO0_20130 [Streptomyces cinereoruber]|uniref:hypothetical protein n=1 Tax=Streptomyces cinereoruber TaxID=67260 RepID=UPI003635FE10